MEKRSMTGRIESNTREMSISSTWTGDRISAFCLSSNLNGHWTRIQSPSLQQPLTKKQDVFVTLQLSFTGEFSDLLSYCSLNWLLFCFLRPTFDALSLQIYRSPSLALVSLVVSRNVDMSMFSWFPISEYAPVNTNPSAQVPGPCEPRTSP